MDTISKRNHSVEDSILDVLQKDGNESEKIQPATRTTAVEDRKANFPSPLAPNAYPCKDTQHELPQHPSTWPQRPLMVRPTPCSSTKIIGIRRAISDNYENFKGCCAGCILPINNGRELEGESLVVDFESTNFVGTLFLRIKDVPPLERGKNGSMNNDEENDIKYGQSESIDYFADRKRKFQAIIKGRFKKALAMNRCVTGQSFKRPAGKLPAKWLVSSFIKFVSILAPQLDASLDGNSPRFLTPLLATANTVLSQENGIDETGNNSSTTNKCNRPLSSEDGSPCLKIDTTVDLEEPSSLEPSSVLSSLLAHESNPSIKIPDTSLYSSIDRTVSRKKVFNLLSAMNSPEPRFDCDRIYTFEFYQHLLELSRYALDMGSVGGMIPLAQATDGQPLKIMAAHRESDESQELDILWSFDIFHESLYAYAELAVDQVYSDS
ncbi:unnamed protein product [Pseudo-nitzschia multistriata]|uniref:Domain of unknown function at the cortex 1 domain-containing protein n=1 Tax=Pseudo-nitzschia multistriata TaxID=183589 RepID=A0A448Z4E4_9STRA|nr:unnamed protein product [Pseudo-nitzschia multistriata]